MVRARLFAIGSDGKKRRVCEALFSAYNATYILQGNDWVATGGQGWDYWAKPLLQPGEYGEVELRGRLGIQYVEVCKGEPR